MNSSSRQEKKLNYPDRPMLNMVCHAMDQLIDEMATGNYLFAILSSTSEVYYSRYSAEFDNLLIRHFTISKPVQWDYFRIQPVFKGPFQENWINENGTPYLFSTLPLPIESLSDYTILYLAPNASIRETRMNLLILINQLIGEHVQYKKVSEQKESNELFTFAIMNSLSFGVVAVNLNEQVVYANDHACVSVNIRRRELLQIPVSQLIPSWSSVFQIVAAGGKFQNEEVMVNTEKGKIKYNLNVAPIYDFSKQLIGMVISLRELDNMYQIVHKYTGMQARFTFEDIVCKSTIMRKLIDYAKTVADSPSTILIEGESGTGKEVIAQSIHNASSRSDAGFVAINCAAIPDSLIESELFGYDDGAFTGAKKGGHPGKFELAHGGTLFLDEIGDMKPDIQARILRAIQESAVTRIGGTKLIPVDVRIIAATHRDLKREVELGAFRLDLYYRLSVIPLKIPPLRERKSDLPTLIRHFLNKKSVKLQKEIPHIRYSDFQVLLEYSWPGNIRELENFIEQLVNLNGQFPGNYFQSSPPIAPYKENKSNSALLSTDFIPLSIEEMEKKIIQNTILHCNGNLSQSAKILGISRNTLYLKLRKINSSQ